jgi:acyl-CoA hydrolase/GNAT superfamily N-acetyltransferase
MTTAASDDWRTRWADKVMDAAAAVKKILPGRRILIGSGAAEPIELVNALATHGDHLADNEIVHLLTLGPAPYVVPGLERRFRHTAFFIGENVREAVAEGRADFMPVFLSEIPRLITSRRLRIDVALVEVSPPDAHGYVSLGVSVDVIRAAVDTADVVLAEVNPNMPRTHGDSFLHVDDVAALVPVDYPLLERVADPPDEVDRTIAANVASLVPDGATLQLGIGKLPDAVLAALGDRRDLGIHTEMFSDGVMKLVEAGVINGADKTLLPGKLVTSFIMGSRALYAWAHDNPAIEMRSSSFTNDPFTIARNDRMVAVNSALAVDLTGQVAADTRGGRFFSGIGGQVDFIRGASRSRGGAPIIALRSTAKGGTISRIQHVLEQGAGIVTSRGDVHYVVTEYGVADLWGKNIRQRARALIEIAHPAFRAELLAAAKERKWVLPDQIAPRASGPLCEATTHPLGDVTLEVRPVRVADEDELGDVFRRLSDESTFQRFLGHRRTHPHEELQRLVDLDDEQSMALVAVAKHEGRDEIVGMTRYDRDPATGLGDAAFVVRDEWQGRGIGTILMRRIVAVARARGLAGLSADVLRSNPRMMRLFEQSGLAVSVDLDAGVYHVVARFSDPSARPPVLV